MVAGVPGRPIMVGGSLLLSCVLGGERTATSGAAIKATGTTEGLLLRSIDTDSFRNLWLAVNNVLQVIQII